MTNETKGIWSVSRMAPEMFNQEEKGRKEEEAKKEEEKKKKKKKKKKNEKKRRKKEEKEEEKEANEEEGEEEKKKKVSNRVEGCKMTFMKLERGCECAPQCHACTLRNTATLERTI